MKFRDYYSIPQNLLTVPADALTTIEQSAVNGTVKLYFPTAINYPAKSGSKWKTVLQLIDFNIDTDSIVRIYPYVLTRKGKRPPPRECDLNGQRYFTPEWMPKALVQGLKKKAKYYREKQK